MELFIGAYSELGAERLNPPPRGVSQHLLGNAVDIVIDGLTPIEMYCLGNLVIRSYSEEFQGWTLQVDRRFEPTIQDWEGIQRIADYLLSSPGIL